MSIRRRQGVRKAFSGHGHVARRARPRKPNGAPLLRFAIRVGKVAERINRAAENIPKRTHDGEINIHTGGAFGDDKVFISAAWAVGKFNMSLAKFKKKLIEAHEARFLTLARADLVSAMDPHDVARSETRFGNSTFHFIKLD